MPLVRTLRDIERARLEHIVRTGGGRSALVMRAQIILKAATGMPNTAIAEDLGTSRQTVLAWRKRYATGGLRGLSDLPRTGRPRNVDEALIVAATLTSPPRRSKLTHWSTRTLSAAIETSHSSIADVWRRWKLRPHMATQPSLPLHPPLSPWARGVIGLHLNPPEFALAVTTDTARALPTLDELLTPHAGFGSVTVQAGQEFLRAMFLASRRVVEHCPPSQPHEDFIEFLIGLVRRYPITPLHVIFCNTSSLDHPETRYWLARHPSIHVHLSSESPDWFQTANVLLCTAMTGAGVTQPILNSRKLIEGMRAFVRNWSDARAPFTWYEPLISHERPSRPAAR